MLIKVNNTYLDFGQNLEVVRKVKLFEEAATIQGDVSYSFILPSTVKNRSVFNLFSINQSSKTIYQKIPAILEDDGGIPIYFGFIKVEGQNSKEIHCSFFSGNTNWFSLLDFDLRDFDFSTFDIDWDLTTIAARESATTGGIYPVINLGAMVTRSHTNWLLDDFHPFIYCHSIITYLLNRQGIKLTGGILKDWRYLHLITSNGAGGLPQEEINSRKTSVGKTSTQEIGTSAEKITFELESGDYFTGDLWDTTDDRYTADHKMVVDITVNGTLDSGSEFTHFYIYRNGAEDREIYEDNDAALKTISGYALEDGDYIELFAQAEASTADITSFYLTITPTRIYRSFTEYLLPNWKANEFVARVFSLFNPVINYEPISKTLTVDLFKAFTRRTPLDISKYIDPSTIEIDYVEIMQNYGRLNNFTYQDSTSEGIETYNARNTLAYGSGQLDSENELVAGSASVIDSQFSAVLEDIKNPLHSFLPHLEWRGVEETGVKQESITLTDSAGLLITASDLGGDIAVGDLIRITNSTVEVYNGEWVITALVSPTTFRAAGMEYVGDGTADLAKLEITYNRESEQVVLLAVHLAVSWFSNQVSITYGPSTSASSPATAYFYKPLQGLNFDDDYSQSLSFGAISVNNTYQRTLLDDYWDDFNLVIQDPIRLRASAHFPKSVFDSLLDAPAFLLTSTFSGRFFVNKITGYKSSYQPCEIELIKVSPYSPPAGLPAITSETPPDPTDFESEYQDILAYAELQTYTLPSGGQQIKQNQLLKTLKEDGVWDDLDLLYVFATDGDSDFAKINWKDPGSFDAIEVNSPTFTENEGFNGDGSTSYLNTGWAPDPDGVNFTQDEGGIFTHINTDIIGLVAAYGSRGSSSGGLVGQNFLATRGAGAAPFDALYSINSNALQSEDNATGIGFYHTQRTSSSDLILFKNGATFHDSGSPAVSSGLSDKEIYLFTLNANGTPALYSTNQISIFGIGASLTGKESALYTAWNNYFTSL